MGGTQGEEPPSHPPLPLEILKQPEKHSPERQELQPAGPGGGGDTCSPLSSLCASRAGGSRCERVKERCHTGGKPHMEQGRSDSSLLSSTVSPAKARARKARQGGAAGLSGREHTSFSTAPRHPPQDLCTEAPQPASKGRMKAAAAPASE